MRRKTPQAFLLFLPILLLLFQLAIDASSIGWYCMRNKAHKQPIFGKDLSIVEQYNAFYMDRAHGDGSAEKVDILWGENVGPCKEENALLKLMSYTREPIFTCDFEDKNDLRYYRFVIPVKKPVLSVETEIFEQFKDKYTLDSIKICNQ